MNERSDLSYDTSITFYEHFWIQSMTLRNILFTYLFKEMDNMAKFHSKMTCHMIK